MKGLGRGKKYFWHSNWFRQMKPSRWMDVNIQTHIQTKHTHTHTHTHIHTHTHTHTHAVIKKSSSTTPGFISSKSRLSKKNTSISRLELARTVIVANLAENIENSLTKLKITAVNGWSHTMVCLLWIKGNGIYKQSVQNRVNFINSKPTINYNFGNR